MRSCAARSEAAQGKEIDMKRERNIRTRRSSLSPIALSLLVWITGALVCGGMPARAAAQATRVDSSIQINVSGRVTAADGTEIKVSGQVIVNSSAVPNRTGALSSVILTLDFSNVTARVGSGAHEVAYDTKGFQSTKIRPLKASDVIQIVVPYSPSGSGPTTEANTLLVTATLNFNVATGVLVNGSITVGNNTFSSPVWCSLKRQDDGPARGGPSFSV